MVMSSHVDSPTWSTLYVSGDSVRVHTRFLSVIPAAREKGLLEEIANSIPVVYVNIALDW